MNVKTGVLCKLVEPMITDSDLLMSPDEVFIVLAVRHSMRCQTMLIMTCAGVDLAEIGESAFKRTATMLDVDGVL